ncbi:TorD/DmsD family molecular chaperone [Arenibaculum pallidiluteum]|uniref:TorD/DmsD family molecular chaperone n=1 Tax=Arenibaculum pallidiluteum TaxID=2812559 RepID=UPI001A957EA9|nr:molecular chaperone TorD family protein [Arenibaculum pallidiluteum]
MANGHTHGAPDGAEMLRAHAYGLLATLLAGPPDAGTLGRVGAITGDEGALGQALAALGAAARSADPAAVEREYHDLFIGVGRGELLPYGSFYLTGFLNERPLAILRGDMAALGIDRAEGRAEPEDHIASLCEMMAGLIAGAFGDPAEPAAQRQFFERHMARWASRFFQDLEKAEAAVFYRAVGTVGREFMAVEAEAFRMIG